MSATSCSYIERVVKAKGKLLIASISLYALGGDHTAGRTVTGEFTALMGPSGAGKTTLMDCIALRQRSFEGAIHVDGRSPKSDYFTQTGYVHQKELFFSSLTSREHLVFHAINRLGGKYTKDQCMKRVDEVINEVELARCADTIIGGGEFALVKGLSGGERKRLSIGTELLSHPKIIFLDEPTSGLDSVMGELVTNLLAALATGKNGGPRRVIMCVIHTPSSRMWSHFSHVLLLATGGFMAYHGTREALFPYFKSLGYDVPPNYNPADFALEVFTQTFSRSPLENIASAFSHHGRLIRCFCICSKTCFHIPIVLTAPFFPFAFLRSSRLSLAPKSKERRRCGSSRISPSAWKSSIDSPPRPITTLSPVWPRPAGQALGTSYKQR